jgi:hypothetical protein
VAGVVGSGSEAGESEPDDMTTSNRLLPPKALNNNHHGQQDVPKTEIKVGYRGVGVGGRLKEAGEEMTEGRGSTWAMYQRALDRLPGLDCLSE